MKPGNIECCKTDASLYIIGHEHFNKSLTLDVENRLMHYLMSVDKVRPGTQWKRKSPEAVIIHLQEFEGIFQKNLDRAYMSRMKNFFQMKIS